jgi:mannose-6-phosphate isomerase-like protein (cupin superfamily)
MASQTPTIVDLDAEAPKLTTFVGMTPQTTFAERKGSFARLGSYRDGLLLLGKSGGGTGHWEIHREDELLHILDGTRTFEFLEKDGPRAYTAGAGTIVIVPKNTWHRGRSAGPGVVFSATLPGPHIEVDVDDPRTVEPTKVTPGDPPRIVDLAAQLAALRMFRRSPHSTAEDRKGSVARLSTYRDGLLLAIKAAGKDHWERHLTGDELIHVLDGAATLEMVCDDGPPRSFALVAGTVAVIPQGAWHRFLSPEGFTQIAVTPFPGETIERDVDDPRAAEPRPI